MRIQFVSEKTSQLIPVCGAYKVEEIFPICLCFMLLFHATPVKRTNGGTSPTAFYICFYNVFNNNSSYVPTHQTPLCESIKLVIYHINTYFHYMIWLIPYKKAYNLKKNAEKTQSAFCICSSSSVTSHNGPT